MTIPKIVIALAMTTVLSGAPASSASPAAAVPQCAGCSGGGGSSSASGGSCGGFVSVSVTMTSGRCRVFHFYEPWSVACASTQGCTPTVQRSWSGLTPGSVIDFCVGVGQEVLCLDPKPVVGSSGAGSDSRSSSPMSCSNDPAGSRSFSVSSASCGLSAAASASCTGCSGGDGG